MAKWEGKTRGGVLGHRIFVFLIKHFNLTFVYFILRFVVLYYFLNSRKSFSAIYKYYRHAHKLSVLKSFFKIYSNYYIFGQILLDKTIVLAGMSNKFTYDFDGEEYLREISAAGKGGLLIGAHMGSWDMAGFLLKRLDYKVNIMFYDADHRNVKEFLAQTYGGKEIDARVNFIVIKDDLSHLIEMKNALSKGEILTVLGDRFIENHKHFRLNFLGMEANFPVGPFYIATRFDIPVTFVFTMKEKISHYHFYASKPKYYKNISGTGNEDNDMQILMNDYIAMLEIFVRKYPEQWFNFFDFWDVEKS
jgi:predicted LPLAT superfamily acyltransferase